MFTRRLVLTGLGATSVTALVPSKLWAAPIKPDDAEHSKHKKLLLQRQSACLSVRKDRERR